MSGSIAETMDGCGMYAGFELMGRRPALTVTLVGLLALASPGASVAVKAQSSPIPSIDCAVQQELAAELERIAAKPEAERSTLYEEALDRWPHDVHLHRAYQDHVMRSGGEAVEQAALRLRYAAAAADAPGSATSLYLHARSLPDEAEAESRQLSERALALDPASPWPHLALARAAVWPGPEPDLPSLREHAAAFLRLCPDEPDIFRLIFRARDSGLEVETTPALRALLGRRLDRETVGLFPLLWGVEFRHADPSEHEALRERVAADCRRIEAAGLGDEPASWRALIQGWQIADDLERMRRAEDELARRFACTPDGAAARRAIFEREHPPPTTAADRPPYNRALWEASAKWVKDCPEDVQAWFWRLRGALEPSAGVDDAALGAVADALLTRWVAGHRGIMTRPTIQAQIADEYLRRRIRLDRIADLGRSARQELEREASEMEARLEPDASVEEREDIDEIREAAVWEELRLVAAEALASGRLDHARTRLDVLGAWLAEREPGDEAADEAKAGHDDLRAHRFELEARLAIAEDRKLDALAFYGDALRLSLRPTAQLEEEARLLWRQLGGSDEGWVAWMSSKGGSLHAEAAVGGWQIVDRPLPEFELTGLDGRRWNRTDLEGKLVFVNFWALWCGPCLAELPWVERLHAELEQRPEAVLLTINMDPNPGRLAPFLRERGYRFPVVPAYDWATSTLAEMETEGIPRNWIIDAEGTIRAEQAGFGAGEGDEWLASARNAIDRVRAAPRVPGEGR